MNIYKYTVENSYRGEEVNHSFTGKSPAELW